MNAGEKAVTDSKAKIRNRYKGVDPSELEVIMPIASDEIALENRKLKVAGYVRVSTENDEQTSSYELQMNDFTDRINANPNWEFAGIYSDEGISGTELSHRKGMLQMIEDARAGKIDHILAKSIARFARNVVDCLSIIDELRQLGVGVHFDENNLYTLDATGSLVLTILATVAEEESRSKSFIMNWSIERRFSKGIFLTPKLLGYDVDEEGNLVVNPDEAETVKVIYDLYVNGWSATEIADLLTSYGRPTKLGNEVWNPGSVDGVIENERHCGDVRARKTYTPDFKTHKSVKNEGANLKRKQYIQRNHHEPIVSRDVYNAANLLKSSRLYSAKSHPLPILSVIDGGILQGYVPIDKNWTGFSAEEYQAACESVEAPTAEVKSVGRRLNLGGYQLVRSEFFPSIERPAMTISNGKLRFNTACLKKFEDVEYVELLLNTVTSTIAIRPCEKDNPNAIHWGRLREERWVVSTLGCKGLSRTLFDLMSWEDEGKYTFSGQFKVQGENKLLLFELGEPIITKTVEQIIVPDEAEEEEQDGQQEEIVIREQVRVYPESWVSSFGEPVNVLVQQHYSGDWDVLRPATEIEEMNILTAEKLDQLMKEAETIKWLWYPYIAIGKITLLQGDPGDGKSTMMMNLIAELSKGGATPDGVAFGRPHKIIYQCSEDKAGDTIKPRLEAAGADCRNIAFINEEVHEGLTLDDERIRNAIIECTPQLVVIDPIQSYLENDSDMQIAVRARKIMRRLGMWASTYNCAIVLIGHLSKKEGGKEIYRGLGSIDLTASVRSVLHVERDSQDEDIRIVKQIKNNLAETGKDLHFEIRRGTGFRWLQRSNHAEAPTETVEPAESFIPKNKHELAALLIKKALANGPMESMEIKKLMVEYRIGDKTMNEVKTELGIKPYRKMRTWYWVLPGENNKEVES